MRHKTGRKLTTAMAIGAALGLGACTQYYVGDQFFDTKEEALAWIEAEIRKDLAKVEPRDRPLGSAVILVLPDEDHLRAIARRDYPNKDEDIIDLWTKGQTIVGSVMADAIKRRNIFATVRLIGASTPEGLVIPSNGYLMWYEQRTGDDVFLHVMAAGEAETTELVPEPLSDEKKGYQRLVEEIEDYVRAHPPVP